MASPTLTQLRKKIDAIDRQILSLLARRARVAVEVGRAKSRRSKGVLDVGRENAVLTTVRENNPGPLQDEAVEAVFREIISVCRASQSEMAVALLGPEGTFSHEAAIRQFGRTAHLEFCDTIGDVFACVDSGRCAYGVVPVENTTEGAVTPTLDSLAVTTATVLAELEVKVEHCLLSKSGDRSKVKRIASHPQPLAQCRRFLANGFPGVERTQTASTAAAAKLARQSTTTAAIAGRLAGELYNLKVVAPSIQDSVGNVTRFLVLGKGEPGKATGNDRTSLIIAVRDEVGILEKVLRPFAVNGVNLSMIESRPLAGRSWEYSFFVDVSGHARDAKVRKALAAVQRVAVGTKVLGSYPVAS